MGLPYSSCRTVEKYLAWNISMETFFSALKNPNSVIYTREILGVRGAHSYYGIVCSMFVSYALQLPYRVACKLWTCRPDIKPVDSSKLENLQLCDIVLDPTHHVAIVTDIQRDVDGNVHFIEVTEAVMPTIERRTYNPEQFREFWLNDGYSIHRYDYVDQVTYEPDPFVPIEGDPVMPEPKITTALMLDFGNKANYRVGDEPVEISVFEEGWEKIEVTAPNGEKTLYDYEDNKLVLNPTVPGFYTACLYKDGERSDIIEWCMVDLRVNFEKETFKMGDEVKFTFENDADDVAFHFVLNDDAYYVQGSHDLEKEESESGKSYVRTIPAPGKYLGLLLAKNEYGIYSSKYTPFTVEE